MIDMVFKKETMSDAGTQAELDDKGNFIARRGIQEKFEPTDAVKAEVTKEPEEVKPKVLAVVDDSKKSKLMLAELKERKVNVVSEVKADFKNVAKEVQDIIKSESDKHNDYQVVYLPVTNDDYNKNVAEYTKLRSTATVPINLYFQDRNDVDIANKAFTRKIE